MDKAKGTQRIIEQAHRAAEAYEQGDTHFGVSLEQSIVNLAGMYGIDPIPLIDAILPVRNNVFLKEGRAVAQGNLTADKWVRISPR